MAGEEATTVALVVLRPGSGRAITGDSVITATTLHEFAPGPGQAEAVARRFADAGFDVGPLVGIAMSVAASRGRFEQVFGVRVEGAEGGGWIAAGRGRELPLDGLPDALREGVHAVTFEPPAETVELP